MSITLTRVDNRLIHGQIVEGWLPVIKVDEVVVVSDLSAQSVLAKKMFRMSLPSGYGLQVLNGGEAAEYIKKETPARQFILAEGFKELKEMVDKGFTAPLINIGNTKYEAGKKRFSDSVFLSLQDMDFIKELLLRNIRVEARALPSSFAARIR
jgi:PTS system mannose-specific IIB component